MQEGDRAAGDGSHRGVDRQVMEDLPIAVVWHTLVGAEIPEHDLEKKLAKYCC